MSDLITIYCPTCGIPFGITPDWRLRLRECRNTFYCPSGHAQSYRGESEIEQLRRVLRVESERVGELTIKLLDAENKLKKCKPQTKAQSKKRGKK